MTALHIVVIEEKIAAESRGVDLRAEFRAKGNNGTKAKILLVTIRNRLLIISTARRVVSVTTNAPRVSQALGAFYFIVTKNAKKLRKNAKTDG